MTGGGGLSERASIEPDSPPGTPGVPGRMSQIINAVPTTIPALTATAVMTSERGRDGTNC